MAKLWVTLSVVYLVSFICMLAMDHMLGVVIVDVDTKETMTFARNIFGGVTLGCGTISSLWILLTKQQ